MFCQKCGKEIEDESRFCEFCGAEQTLSAKIENSAGSRNRKKFIIIGSVILTAVLLAAGVFMWQRYRGKAHSAGVDKKEGVEKKAAPKEEPKPTQEEKLLQWIPADMEALGEKGPLYLAITMTQYSNAAPEMDCSWPTSEYEGILAAKELDSEGEDTQYINVSSSASAEGEDGGRASWALTVTSGVLHGQTGEAEYSNPVMVLNTGFWYQGNHDLFIIKKNEETYLFSFQAFYSGLQAVDRFFRADVYKIDGTSIQRVKSLKGGEMMVTDLTNSDNGFEGEVLCRAETGDMGKDSTFHSEAAACIRNSLAEYHDFGDWFLEEYVKRFSEEAGDTAFAFPVSEKEEAAVDILRTEQSYIRNTDQNYGVIQYHDYTDLENRMRTELKRQGKKTERAVRPELPSDMTIIDGGKVVWEQHSTPENTDCFEVVPAAQVEEKVAEIRSIYVDTNNRIDSGEYKECIDYDTGIKGFGFGGDSRRIEISKGMDQENDTARIYQYDENGKLIFVLLLEEEAEKRLYFSEGQLFRYRYQKRGGQDAVNYDNDFSNPEFVELGKKYAEDGVAKHADIFVAYRVNLTNASKAGRGE